MVKNRQPGGTGIPELGFSAPVGTPAGIEVMSLARLRGRTSRDPLRPTFHHIVSLDSGVLAHTVDFTVHTLTPGRWLWVRPGQVQQWGDLHTADGTLVLFEPEFLDPATAAAVRLDDPHAPAVHQPDPGPLDDALTHLAGAFARPGHLPLEIRQAELRHLLAVLVLRLTHGATHPDARPDAHPDARSGDRPGDRSGARLGDRMGKRPVDRPGDRPGARSGGRPGSRLGDRPGDRPAPSGDTFVRFRDAVERDFARTRRLEDYAHRLGYSPRTLSRATQAAAGVNAKDFIDRRLVLETKRLLAHSDHTAAQIAARLGFTSATNFSKYFRERAGVTPIAFRTSVRTPAPAPGL